MHRLWFRLDDVVPLAEHAMACVTHRVTGAQATALAPSGPALVWTSTAVLDLLTSNGVPVWYGERGSIQAAEAHAWRDASGRYGTAWRDGYDSAYLPLTTHDGGTGPVIDLLRGARHIGHSWVTLDIDPADGHLIGASRVDGVGLPPRPRPGRHRVGRQAMVTCRDVDDLPYPALVADGYTSDSGHLLARLDRPTIQRLAADLDAVHANPDRTSDPMPGEYPILRLHGDVLTVLEQHDNGHAETYRATDHLTPDGEGYYPLGAYLWPWRHAHQSSRRRRRTNGTVTAVGASTFQTYRDGADVQAAFRRRRRGRRVGTRPRRLHRHHRREVRLRDHHPRADELRRRLPPGQRPAAIATTRASRTSGARPGRSRVHHRPLQPGRAARPGRLAVLRLGQQLTAPSAHHPAPGREPGAGPLTRSPHRGRRRARAAVLAMTRPASCPHHLASPHDLAVARPTAHPAHSRARPHGRARVPRKSRIREGNP